MPAHRSPTRGRRRRPRSGCRRSSQHLRRARVHRRGPAARRRASPTSATCRRRQRHYAAVVARGEVDFGSRLRRHPSSLTWMPACRSRRWPGCIPGATSCSRTSPSARISDLRGKRVGIQDLSSSGHLLPGDHGGARRARSPQRHRVGHQPDGNVHGALRRRQGRRLPRRSRPSRRSCAPARSVA